MKATLVQFRYFARALAALVICTCLLLVSGQARAVRVNNSVSLDGASSVQVSPGATITVAVNASPDGANAGRWRGTGWLISNSPPGTVTCFDNTNHDSAGTFSETFTITAPATAGTYNFYLVTYSNNNCTTDAVTTTLSNAVVVVTPPVVSSIARTSANPTETGLPVSWTVTFSKAVTGVDAADFSLVQTGGVTGASISSVTGSGTTWTVTASTGTGTTAGTLGLNLVDNDTIMDGSSIRLGGTGAGNGNFTGEVYTISAPTLPVVNSIVRANANPVGTGTAPSWTVTFNRAVSGVDASDFALVSSYGVSGASITSVSGSGTTWTVTANSGNGNGGGNLGLNLVDDDSIIDAAGHKLGGTGTGNGNFTGEVYLVSPPCTQPTNTPSGLTLSCVCDNFDRAGLNPSPIYNSSWIVSTSDSTGVVPNITNQGYLRLTNNSNNNAKAATVPGIFPAAGNYISVEYRLFAYNGSSADGVGVTLSDYAVTPVPGAFGGSLGYAQKSNPGSDCTTVGGCPGFAGGWIGVGIDEFGNYQNPSEGRIGGPGARAQSVAVRGSGAGMTGYRWLTGTAANLSPALDSAASTTPAPGHRYQVIVDARNDPASTAVTVNRDTGSGYGALVNMANVYATATGLGFTQASAPANWYISMTGSTGGSTNIHEISSVRICATSISPPGGGVASNFSAIDEAYGTPPATPVVQDFQIGRIFMKLVGVPFKLNVAALNNNQIVTTYAASSNRAVTVKLVDNSDGACVIDSNQPNYCSATCRNKAAVTGGSQVMTFTSGDAGKKLSSNFTLNTAYKNLVAIISDDSTPTPTSACATDAFSVRPQSFAPVTITATNPPKSVFKAGSDQFTITATTTGVTGSPGGYTGVPKMNSALVTGTSVAGVIAGTFPAATSGTPSSTSAGTNFTYSEVGSFTLAALGVYEGVIASECNPNCATLKDALKVSSWTGVDSVSAKGDCIDDSFSNTKDANGKYGCLFGTTGSTTFGRFVPDHFALSNVSLSNRSELTCSPDSTFTYMGEPLKATFTLTAQNATNGTTQNYIGALATLDLNTPANFNLGALDSYSASTARFITAITKANPGVVTTSSAHGYVNGDKVYINNVAGMRQVNDQFYTVAVIDTKNFSVGVNTTSYNTYTSGGMAWQMASSGTDLSGRVTVSSSSGSWPVADDSNTGALRGVAKDISLVFALNRRPDNATDGPLMPEFGIAPADTDGVTLQDYNMDIVVPIGPDHKSIGMTQLLFGRLKLTNAVGSDKLDLPIPMKAEFWNAAAGAFVTNISDNCTQLSCANLTLRNYQGGVSLSNVPTSNILLGSSCATPITLNAGSGTLKLKKPTSTIASKGSVEVCVDLGADANNVCTATSASQTWLQGRWRGAAANNDDPWCRATFGVYKNANEFIYFREMY